MTDSGESGAGLAPTERHAESHPAPGRPSRSPVATDGGDTGPPVLHPGPGSTPLRPRVIDPVFIHIPKTGGTSVCAALRTKDTHNPISRRPEGGLRCTIIRNPWDRARSWFHYKGLHGKGTFEEWCKDGCPSKWTVQGTGCRVTHQEDWIESEGVCRMDWIGRFESLVEHYADLLRALGRREFVPLPHENNRGGRERPHYREVWTDEMRNATPWLDAFAERYGYEF